MELYQVTKTGLELIRIMIQEINEAITNLPEVPIGMPSMEAARNLARVNHTSIENAKQRKKAVLAAGGTWPEPYHG